MDQEFNEENFMQIVRITINGVTYDMYSPMLLTLNDEIGTIEALEFGEFVEMKHVVGFLLQYLHKTSSQYNQSLQ